MTRIELQQKKNKAYWKRREMRQRMQLYNKTVEELDRELGRQYMPRTSLPSRKPRRAARDLPRCGARTS